MKRVLIAGPDHGMEFGWILMRWQAKIRWQSKYFDGYDKTYVITSPEKEYIYQDFAEPIRKIKDSGFSENMWRFDDTEVTYITPSKQYCCSIGGDDFIQYGKRKPEKGFIAIHPRKKMDGREWPVEKWNEYVAIILEKDVDVCVIGTKANTHDIKPITLRHGGSLYNIVGMPIDRVVEQLAVTTMIVGPSSGPMHLASLCKCPQLVWTDKKKWNLGICKGTNRERYETIWNPLKTPVRVCDEIGWDPPVQKIIRETISYMEELNG